MESTNSTERTVPVQFVRASRAFRQFKNPPQPHMCIQDCLKETKEKLFINVLGWQKIANPKQYTDPIPLYGGMQVPQGCATNTNKPPLLVFAVMVNPDILKANGKNAANPTDREALVSLLCDFVEAMNPGLVLARQPIIMKDRDLMGELKDVWLAVQNKREREKGLNQDVMYKVYDIDGVGNEDLIEDDKASSPKRKPYSDSPSKGNIDKKIPVKSSKQILMNAGQKSEFDSGMNNCQLNLIDNRSGNTIQSADTTYCTPVYGQIVSTRENHNQINDIQQQFGRQQETTPSTSLKNDWQNNAKRQTESWDEFSKRDLPSITNGECEKSRPKQDKNKQVDITNGKPHYDFFPVFDNKIVSDSPVTQNHSDTKVTVNENSKIIIDPMQKLVLHSTENNICDNKSSAIGSIAS